MSRPVYLKLEKVYHGSFLISKKRYVGYAMFDRPQKNPISSQAPIDRHCPQKRTYSYSNVHDRTQRQKTRAKDLKTDGAVPRLKLDAKGIEIMRRDSCRLVQKTMEHVLKLVFTTRDISQVKAYLVQSWSRILEGHVPLKDFIFAKEVRLGSYAIGYGRPSLDIYIVGGIAYIDIDIDIP